MNSIYHTTNIIPFLDLIFGLILALGVFYLGKILVNNLRLEPIFEKVSDLNYQYTLIGSNFLIIILLPIIIFFKTNSLIILTTITYLVLIFGFLQIYQFFKSKNIVKIKRISSIEILILISIFSYFLISASPVTNADSLDYHLQLAKNILQSKPLINNLSHMHSNLFGGGESLIAIGLIGGSEQFGSILQFSGLISVLGLLKKKNKNSKNFIIYFLGTPILIFFISTIKPQLLHIASNSLVFCLIFFSDNNKKELLRKNFAICFLFLFSSALSKFSFFLSLSLLCIFIFYKSYKYKIFSLLS